MKKDKSSSLMPLLKQVKSYATEKKYSLQPTTPAMKAHDKKVVSQCFHTAGIVVPVDKNGVGYRPLPQTPGKSVDKNGVGYRPLPQTPGKSFVDFTELSSY